MASFTIDFKKTTSDPKTAIKIFESDHYEKACTPYEALDDLNGYVIIDYDSNVMGCNYAEYDGKKYFVTDRIRQPGQKLQVQLRVDSLSTYWTEIKNCSAVVRTTTYSDGWSRYMQGNRLVQAYNVTHAAPNPEQGYVSEYDLDFATTHLFMGIYG